MVAVKQVEMKIGIGKTFTPLSNIILAKTIYTAYKLDCSLLA